MNSSLHTDSSLQGCRVLLVEDVELNRFLVREMVKMHGLLLDIVTNGEEAVNATLSASYDVILMDIHMPVMDGVEATKRIRADGSNPNSGKPIIALSASAFEQEHAAFIEAGMDAVLEKPFSAAQLTTLLQSYFSAGNIQQTGVREEQQALAPQVYAVNMDQLLQTGRGNREFAGMMLRSFRDSAAELITDLEQAAAAGNKPGTAQVLHKLKFAVSVMGAGSLDQELKWIEAAARNPVTENEQEYMQRLSNFTGAIRQLYADAVRLIESGEWG